MRTAILTLILAFLASFAFSQSSRDVSEVEKVQRNGRTIVLFGEDPFTGQLTESYPNGKPKFWISYQDGLPEGAWQEWYENGRLKFSASWKQGKGHGLWEYFYENGTLRQEEFYYLDVPVGIFRDYYTNGQLRVKSSWLDGKKHGHWTYYTAGGELQKIEVYRAGELISTTED